MTKILFSTFLLLSLASGEPVTVFSCKDGTVNFISSAPLEVIKAKSRQLRGAMDIGKRTFLFAIDVNSFEGFNSGLQREHFSENYLETAKYPEATFKGKLIEEMDLTKEGTYDVRTKGVLELHGVQQERIIKGTITVTADAIQIHSQFSVLLEDHNIKIPRIVYQKISPEINVTIDATLKATR
jgi:hypothetical protein